MRVRQFNIHELTPHPLNQKIYGTVKPDAELLKSVAENGVLQPLILDSKQTILAGHRRWMACKILAKRRSKKLVRIDGYENVPCVVSKNKGLDAERVVIEANRQRIKTAQQRIREFKELKRIEAELAKERMSAGGKGVAILPHLRGKSRDKAAVMVGMGARTAEKFEKIVDAADAGSAEARAVMEAVDNGTLTIDAAYQRIFPAPPNDYDNSVMQGQFLRQEIEAMANRIISVGWRELINKCGGEESRLLGCAVALLRSNLRDAVFA
jgi:ParB-like chromosome segregation protein Spo0J